MQLMTRQLTRPSRPDHSASLRLHFMPEWAELRGMSQTEIAESLEINKSTVSKWFNGALPSEANLPRIAAMFGVEVDELFRMPEDNWLANFLRGRSAEERDRIRRTLMAAFPKGTGTDG